MGTETASIEAFTFIVWFLMVCAGLWLLTVAWWIFKDELRPKERPPVVRATRGGAVHPEDDIYFGPGVIRQEISQEEYDLAIAPYEDEPDWEDFERRLGQRMGVWSDVASDA